MTTTIMSGNKKSSNRWNYIDLIEVIGMIFVLIYHCTTYDYCILESESTKLTYFRYFLRTILSTCVPLFFFANGYLLLNRKFDLKKHIIKSIKIVFLTFIWGIIGVMSIALIDKTPLTVVEFLKNVWTWKLGWVNHLWYMGALICIYVFLPVLKKVFDSSRNIFIYFTIIVSVFTFGNTFINYVGSSILCVLGVSKTVYNFNWFNMFNPFYGIRGYAIAYFCIGGLAHEYKDKILAINVKKRNIISLCAIISSCIVLFMQGVLFSISTGEMWDVVWCGYDTILTGINVLAIFVLSLNITREIKVIKYISINTLGIYFMHNIFIHLIRPQLVNISVFNTFSGSCLIAIIILVVSLTCTLFLQKIPGLKKLVTI